MRSAIRATVPPPASERSAAQAVRPFGGKPLIHGSVGIGCLCHLILENVQALQARAAEYDFNDANVATGSACWVPLAERFLAA